ncbi:SPOSA6832_01548 [Sporobolomyces salmonicolor]|uniref:SPOSA6832_01548-mRNA-1:cds n=1 Tax=Sporidiobolus salmonicolor TaxID=5005 RepID=A0A0D6EJN2_SPOSA|nr:SPOSA6832_01548 [Sporobolomyces salmonicolor]
MANNPFEDPHSLDANPFADPAVQQGLYSSAHEFPDDVSTKAASTYTLPEPGVPQQQGGDVQQRLDDLARREQELAARESALHQKQEHIRKQSVSPTPVHAAGACALRRPSSSGETRSPSSQAKLTPHPAPISGRNNWPPGPWPLIFHDIEQEIPEQHRATVLTLYRVWMFLILTLIVNLVAAILLLVSGDRPVYNAYAKEYSFFYYLYFCFAAFHIAFCCYMFIGIPSSGSGGLINLISRFASGSIVAGVFCVLATVGWALEGLASLWMYKNVWAHSHGEQGHTLGQAKQEIQMYGIKAYVFGGKSSNLPANSSQA